MPWRDFCAQLAHYLFAIAEFLVGYVMQVESVQLDQQMRRLLSEFSSYLQPNIACGSSKA